MDRNPDGLAAVVFPDEGCRYQDAVYDDAWLQASGCGWTRLPREPVEWDRPHDGDAPWSFYRWDRRTYAQATTGSEAGLELVA